MEVQDYQTLRALRQKTIDGIRLSEAEIATFERIEAAEEAMNRPAVDFAETEAYLYGGNIQRDALVTVNARAARFRRPQPQAPKPFFSDAPIPQPPASIVLCGPLYRGKKGIERMLDNFRSKLAEAKETGRLP